jgi:ribosomal protein S26
MSGARGSEKIITCDSCHKRIPQSKAIVQHKPMIDKGLAGTKNFVGKYYRPTMKLYFCFKCAKRRGVLK